MELADDIFTVWTGIVTPEKPFVVTTSDDAILSITNLCIYPTEETKTSGRVLLYVKVNDQPEVCLVPFTLGSFESTSIDFQIDSGDVATFNIKGAKANIHMIGNLRNVFEVKTEGAGEPLIDLHENENVQKAE